ncbi:hypothetical protein Poly51_37480 [Rubripirellula tenax]|uniref:Uncharacterized protein n=1 Tax=Rubripirellula tenax TaxID=2528015 RepID=A0A5C6F579_9BACT|nr:hypothetical protein [Rubripirellula tenax]TWU54999.1 hypothetical protein Poly51_37480 [Rubripirellula tenax]
MKLIRVAMPQVEQTILSSEKPVLMIYPGLLARYEQMDVLSRIRERVGRKGQMFTTELAVVSQH